MIRRPRPALRFLVVAALAITASCGGSDEEDFGPAPPLKSRLELLARLGREPRFLVGHGNDLPGAEKNFDFAQAGIYTLPVTLDVHYVYLSGLPREPTKAGVPWPDYRPDGSFVTEIADNAASRGVVPMFTLYQAAARGEQDQRVFRDQDFMTKYWEGVRLLMDRLRATDRPAIVHVEPDFWGYAQQWARSSGEPKDVRVLVRGLVPECADLPDDVGGMGRCFVRLARGLAPKVALGFHASGFGSVGEPKRVARFLAWCGATEADFITLETLDRDVGCFEAGRDPFCTRRDGEAYWDERNERSPNFAEHLAWAATIHERLGLPVLWWQMPLGVASDVPGGAPKQYRDNRVKYFFEHPAEFEQAGGFGAAFGVGAPNQTDITTDGGQFARAVERYYASPLPITRP